MCDLSVVKNFLTQCNETMRFKIPAPLFNGHVACLQIETSDSTIKEVIFWNSIICIVSF
jgi:hypothetical protein